MHTQRDRRRFLQSLAAGGAATAAGSFAAPSRATAQATTTQTASDGFFTVAKQNNRWWFFDPDDNPQFSLGLNHVDPASLRYVENGSVWRERYGNDMRRWLTESVRPNLTEWGFNCLGWNQEVVTRQPTNHRHSRSFTFEEYQWLDMPYCHMLPFSEIHQWQAESKLPDFRSPGFVDWCDHVAREHCSRFRDDPKLIGYWYSDCPVWVHTRAINAWRGPIFDPEKLKSPAGRQELSDLATAYYQTTHDAIRRYDPHHLILGDRYEANAALPDEVVRAAVPLVDVLSFQCFGSASNVQEKLSAWAKKFDRPIVLADHAISRKPSTGAKYHDAAGYAATLQAMTGIPQVVGYHLCGAYVRNRVRNRGLLDENERPDETAIRGIRASNEAVAAWVKTASKVP